MSRELLEIEILLDVIQDIAREATDTTTNDSVRLQLIEKMISDFHEGQS